MELWFLSVAIASMSHPFPSRTRPVVAGGKLDCADGTARAALRPSRTLPESFIKPRIRLTSGSGFSYLGLRYSRLRLSMSHPFPPRTRPVVCMSKLDCADGTARAALRPSRTLPELRSDRLPLDLGFPGVLLPNGCRDDPHQAAPEPGTLRRGRRGDHVQESGSGRGWARPDAGR